MIVPTSAKVGIAGFFNNHKARLQKCLRAFFIVEQFSKLFTPRASNASALALILKIRSVASFKWDHRF